MVLSKLGKTMTYDVDPKFESYWVFQNLKPVCWVIWGLLGGSFYSHPVFLSDSHSLTGTPDSMLNWFEHIGDIHVVGLQKFLR